MREQDRAVLEVVYDLLLEISTGEYQESLTLDEFADDNFEDIEESLGYLGEWLD